MHTAGVDLALSLLHVKNIYILFYLLLDHVVLVYCLSPPSKISAPRAAVDASFMKPEASVVLLKKKTAKVKSLLMKVKEESEKVA